MEISPVTRKEHFLAKAAGDTNALTLQPVTREEHLLQNIIDAIEQGGSGGDVTAEAVATAISSMTTAQAAQALSDLGGISGNGPEIVTPSIIPAENNDGVYLYAAYESSVPVLTVYGTYDDEDVRISGVANPIGNTDAVNKAYVDGFGEAITGATPSITPADNHIYSCGTLTSLTITDPPTTGSYTIKFTSGSTATTTTIPSSIVFPSAFAAEANTRYEINVEDGYAVVVGWPVS